MTLLLINTYHAFAIAHSINFWYESFPLFSLQQLNSLIEVLIKFYFYELFLHWSKNVRIAFYYFLAYRVIGALVLDVDNQTNEVEKIVMVLNKRLNLVE